MRNLKRLCKTIVLPLIIASFTAQAGADVSAGAAILENLSRIALILVINCVMVGLPLWILHNFMPYIHSWTYSNWFQRSLLSVIAVFPMAFGFLGIFAVDMPVSHGLHHLWFYTSIVLGFYFLAIEDEIDMIDSEKVDYCYPAKNFPLLYWLKGGNRL